MKKVKNVRLYTSVQIFIICILTFWVAYFPNTLISTEAEKIRPNFLFYILVPIIFFSMFSTLFTELERLMFGKFKITRLVFSFVFCFSYINILYERFFVSSLCESISKDGLFSMIRIYSFSFSLAFFIISVFSLLLLEVFKKKKIRAVNNKGDEISK